MFLFSKLVHVNAWNIQKDAKHIQTSKKYNPILKLFSFIIYSLSNKPFVERWSVLQKKSLCGNISNVIFIQYSGTHLYSLYTNNLRASFGIFWDITMYTNCSCTIGNNILLQRIRMFSYSSLCHKYVMFRFFHCW